MSRWRDVKKGKVKEQNKTKKSSGNKQNNLVLKNASLMLRFKAFLTDTFMLTMPLMYIVTYIVMGSLQDFSSAKILGWFYILMPHFIIVVSLWHFKRQTPGMKAYDLYLVDSTTGLKPSLASVINRYIFTTLSMPLIFPILLPYLNKSRRSLQDFVSGTILQEIQNTNLEQK
jgi:uncharacterized RDD family membrane protein YckC